MKNVLFGALASAILAAGLGCASNPERHSTVGIIDDIRGGGKWIEITHQDFPGFMEGMTMTFEAADPKLAAGLAPGDTVQFTITKKDDSWPITSISKVK